MEKLIGVILLGLAIAASFYIVTNLDKLTSNTIPVPDKIIDYFKVNPFK